MTQEERDMVLKDLCARLPYGIIVNIPHAYDNEFKAYIKAINPKREIVYYEICDSSSPLFDRNILGIKPYLRPMSSMTDEEMEDYYKTGNVILDCDSYSSPVVDAFEMTFESFDWLNEHHFDYRGLISKGLAVEAPEGMYN